MIRFLRDLVRCDLCVFLQICTCEGWGQLLFPPFLARMQAKSAVRQDTDISFVAGVRLLNQIGRLAISVLTNAGRWFGFIFLALGMIRFQWCTLSGRMLRDTILGFAF